MRDGFGRTIDYLRVSVTDRCNFRCHYCMPEQQRFLPRRELLDYSEIALIAERFMDHGVRRIRLTGGEPLVRRDIGVLIAHLGKYVTSGRLEELTLTTNGSLLADHAQMLAKANVHRINVSLDSLDSDRFASISRGGRLKEVLAGISAAKAVGIAIRINMVALRDINQMDLLPVAQYCAENDFDLALIETMPLGEGVSGRQNDYIALDEFVSPLREIAKFIPLAHRTSGPARYWQVEPLGLRLGMITPLSQNFCDNCNRLRLTTDGKIFMCLGSNLNVDLRQAIREGGVGEVDRLLETALRLKPERHDFENQLNDSTSRLSRHMNATGG
ncbi:GTP 3',8-cyclase MoaA [Sphingorhabdus sp.]|uniref:GTP 3',8-cyclase MoaA n=1 Tax=Sphingorhabdus sp. TaxID=1902408 RepID=UPI003BB1210E